MKKSHKNGNSDDKKSQTSVKKSQKCKFPLQKSQHSVKKTQKCQFK